MKICFWDIETGNLRGDYGSMLVSSIKPFKEKVQTRTANFSDLEHSDLELAIWTRDILEQHNLLVTFYGKGFDYKYLRTRLAYYGERDVRLQWHLDVYWAVKNNFLTSRNSMAHWAEFQELEEKKLSVPPQVWEKASKGDKKSLNILVERCESDTKVLENLYLKVLPYVKTITK